MQGKQTAPEIKAFIVETKANAPELSMRLIADRVVSKFGEKAKVDKSTVGKILQRIGAASWSTGQLTTLTSGNRDGQRKRDLESWVRGNFKEATNAVKGYRDVYLQDEWEGAERRLGLRHTATLSETQYEEVGGKIIKEFFHRNRKLPAIEKTYLRALARGDFEKAAQFKQRLLTGLDNLVRI